MIQILRNYGQDTLYFGYAPHRHFITGAIISGAFALVGGITAASMSASAQRDTNDTNADINRKNLAHQSAEAEKTRDFNAEQAEINREFQAEEAEKNRQFNAEEAAKEREYYSESAVMERRAEAGLNTAVTGLDSATSGASASAPSTPAGSAATSPMPSVPSPIPMRPVDISSDINAMTSNLTKAVSQYFEFKQSEASQSKIGAETESILKEIIRNEEMHAVTMDMQNANLESIKKQLRQQDTDLERLQQTIQVERQGANLALFQMYRDWRASQIAEANIKLSAGQFFISMDKDFALIRQRAHEFAQDLELRKSDLEFKYGTRKRSSSQSAVTNQSDNGSRWNVNGGVSVGSSNLLPVSVNGSINGGYESTENVRSIVNEGDSVNIEEVFANTELGQALSRLYGYIEVLESPVASREIKKEACDAIIRLNLSYESFKLLYGSIDEHNRQMHGLK